MRLFAQISCTCLSEEVCNSKDWQEVAAEHEDVYVRVLESAYGVLSGLRN